MTTEKKLMYEVQNVGRYPKRIYGKERPYTLKPGEIIKLEEGRKFRGIPNIKVTRIEGTQMDEEKVIMPDGKLIRQIKPDRIDIRVDEKKEEISKKEIKNKEVKK